MEDSRVGHQELLVAGVIKEVGRYVDEYNTCQRYKNQSKAPAEKLMPNVILEKP